MKKLVISFSGGRTSGYMTKKILDTKRDEYDIKVIFANVKIITIIIVGIIVAIIINVFVLVLISSIIQTAIINNKVKTL